MNLAHLQTELQKYTREPFLPWGQKQNNHWDNLTNFVYKIPEWNGLKQNIDRYQPANVERRQFFAYASHRWFNFWSARGVETIFSELSGVTAALNPRDRLVDFSINGTTFDHKTSVFPKRYPYDLSFARQNPVSLVDWLYKNQSSQRRQHFHNRLFLVLYDSQRGEHWKLRAELLWLKTKIEAYVRHFDPDKLISLTFEPNHLTLADIIWAIK